MTQQKRVKYAKDKRVDRAVKRLGYENADIYYSPISITIGFFIAGWAMLYVPMIVVGLKYPVILIAILIHILIEYILVAPLNNSIVIHNNDLIIINTNLPFRHITKYGFDEIKYVELNTSKQKNIWYDFISFSFIQKNYIEVYTSIGAKRYYCMGLDIEYVFDVNFIQKTLDDLANVLRSKTNVNFDIGSWN